MECDEEKREEHCYTKAKDNNDEWRKVVRLQNPTSSNFCWLNSIAYMLYSVRLHLVIAETLVCQKNIDSFLKQAKSFFKMMVSKV